MDEEVPKQGPINWNPARYVKYGDHAFWYPIGNTPARNLFDECSSATSALLLGCGDIRNMLETCRASPHAKHLAFALNDLNPSIIARNGLLLAACKETDPFSPKDIDFLWSVWYNLELSKPHDHKMKQLTKKLLKEPDQGWFKFNPRSWNKVSEVLSSWLVDSSDLPNVETVKQERISRIEKYYGRKLDPINGAKHLDMAKFVIHPIAHYLGSDKIVIEDVWANWIDGSLHTDKRAKRNVKVPNATLLHHKTRKWFVHYASSPFRTYLHAINKSDVRKAGRLGRACQNHLGVWVCELLKRINAKSIKIQLSAENALEFCR